MTARTATRRSHRRRAERTPRRGLGSPGRGHGRDQAHPRRDRESGAAMTMLDPRTADMLAKLCGLFSSDHDGERASAAQKADQIIRSRGLSWRQIIFAADSVEAAGASSTSHSPHATRSPTGSGNFCLASAPGQSPLPRSKPRPSRPSSPRSRHKEVHHDTHYSDVAGRAMRGAMDDHPSRKKPPVNGGSTAKAAKGWRSHVFTAAALRTMAFPPGPTSCRALFPKGCTILAGRPKIGKSWMALDLAIGIAPASLSWAASMSSRATFSIAALRTILAGCKADDEAAWGIQGRVARAPHARDELASPRSRRR